VGYVTEIPSGARCKAFEMASPMMKGDFQFRSHVEKHDGSDNK
jgi:hypothetical protein